MKSKPLKKPGDHAPKGFTAPKLFQLYEGDSDDEDDFSSTGTITSQEDEEIVVPIVVVPRRKIVPVIHILQEEMDFRD